MRGWGMHVGMMGFDGGRAQGVGEAGAVLRQWQGLFGQGGGCSWVVYWGGLCLFYWPVLLSQGGGQVRGVQMAGLWFRWWCWFGRRLGQSSSVVGRWGGNCLICTGALESESTGICAGNWSRGGICESRRGSGAWPRVNSWGLSRSAGAAVDSVGPVPGARGVGGASCSTWGVLREGVGVWHLLSSFSL